MLIPYKYSTSGKGVEVFSFFFVVRSWFASISVSYSLIPKYIFCAVSFFSVYDIYCKWWLSVWWVVWFYYGSSCDHALNVKHIFSSLSLSLSNSFIHSPSLSLSSILIVSIWIPWHNIWISVSPALSTTFCVLYLTSQSTFRHIQSDHNVR